MDTPEEITRDILEDSIENIEQLISSAKSCLQDKDYFQCAVRLEMITPIKFDETLMRVFESLSGS